MQGNFFTYNKIRVEYWNQKPLGGRALFKHVNDRAFQNFPFNRTNLKKLDTL